MARSLALSFFVGGVSAKAYFPAVFRSMPSFRAMARRESPYSVACYTASQRACWVSAGVRRNWWRTGFVFPPLPLVATSSSLASSSSDDNIGRFKGGQAFPLSLVQMAVDHPIGALLLFRAGGAGAGCAPQR